MPNDVPKTIKHLNAPLLKLLEENTRNASFIVSLLSTRILNNEEGKDEGEIIFIDSVLTRRECCRFMKRVHNCSPPSVENTLNRFHYYCTFGFSPQTRRSLIQNMIDIHGVVDKIYIDSLWSLISEKRSQPEIEHVHKELNELAQIFNIKIIVGCDISYPSTSKAL